MKASELRIGNLVEFRNHIQSHEIVKITPRWFKSSIMDDDFELNGYWHPIPIEREWLIYFGLEKVNGYGFKFAMGKIIKHENGFFFHYNDIVIRLDFVHQAQNLYFALTREELNHEIK